MSPHGLERSGASRRLLLVGPNTGDQHQTQSLLEAAGFRILRAREVGEACQKLAVLAPDLVVADLSAGEWRDPRQGLFRLLDRAQAAKIPAPVLVLQPAGEWAPSVEDLHAAGADFLNKPVEAETLLGSIERLLARRFAHRPSDATALPPELIIGRGPAILRVLEQVRLVAPKSTSVLITGETGTGKERVSRAIHYLSHRRDRAMVSVNCGGIPATLLEDEFFGHVKGAFTDAHQARTGRFEQANHSTIFLDEVGDLPLDLQPKLLRVLQEREIHRVGGAESVQLDVRVIAATNLDLWSRVNEGRFREDLFYRLNVIPIHLPPLRDRREDIPLFAAHFLEKFCRRDKLGPKRLRPAAEADLMSRPWPGNIRELENAVEIAVIRGQDRAELDVSDFPAPRSRSHPSSPAPEAADFKGLVTQFERDLILRALESTNGNKSQAAQILRLKRTTLIEKLKKLGAEVEIPY
jgi:DNA-binding NtrC family response regulator